MEPRPSVRTVEVEARPDARVPVGRLAVAIALATLVTAGANQRSPDAPVSLLPYQVVFDRLEPTVQTVIRELQLAVVELCLMRVDLGEWPEPGALAELAIAPFSPVLTVGGEIGYRWETRRMLTVLYYHGEPEVAGLPRLLVRVEEAPPDADPAHLRLLAADASHQKLDDGSIVHYSVWTRSMDEPERRMRQRPELAGWNQVVPRRDAAVEGG